MIIIIVILLFSRDYCKSEPKITFGAFSYPCRMVFGISCGDGEIRVYTFKVRQKQRGGYEPQDEYRAAYIASKQPRVFGAMSTSLRSAVASLLPKLKLKPDQKEALWAEEMLRSEELQQAISHKPHNESSRSAIVFFEKHPHEGIVRTYKRADQSKDLKVRMYLCRKGHDRVVSNWHRSFEEAFKFIQEKCESMGSDIPAMSHKRSVDAGVDVIHQAVSYTHLTLPTKA